MNNYPDADIEEMKAALEQEVKAAAKDDKHKIRLSLVPRKIIIAIARIREYGCRKYHDPENWRQVERKRYHEALLRHTLAIWNDVDAVDPESGMPHLWHIACNVAFLIEMKEPKND